MAISTQPAGTRSDPILMGQVLPGPIMNRVGYGFFFKNPIRVRVGFGFYKKFGGYSTQPDPVIRKLQKKPHIYIYIYL